MNREHFISAGSSELLDRITVDDPSPMLVTYRGFKSRGASIKLSIPHTESGDDETFTITGRCGKADVQLRASAKDDDAVVMITSLNVRPL